MVDTIVTLDSIQNHEFYCQIEEIFFLSSSVKNFESDQKKDNFFKTWCGDYMRLWPKSFYLYLKDQRVMAYIAICKDSEEATELLSIPGFELFRDQFRAFPAHLHINAHPSARGLGIGSKLIERAVSDLAADNIHGLHLITGKGARNVSFYKKCGFTIELSREFRGSELLFLGRPF